MTIVFLRASYMLVPACTIAVIFFVSTLHTRKMSRVQILVFLAWAAVAHSRFSRDHSKLFHRSNVWWCAYCPILFISRAFYDEFVSDGLGDQIMYASPQSAVSRLSQKLADINHNSYQSSSGASIASQVVSRLLRDIQQLETQFRTVADDIQRYN